MKNNFPIIPICFILVLATISGCTSSVKYAVPTSGNNSTPSAPDNIKEKVLKENLKTNNTSVSTDNLTVAEAVVDNTANTTDKHDMPAIKVLPWNGAKSAVSLTFDDGDKSQWETALPALNKKGLKATFFLIAGNYNDKEIWSNALKQGHEIGNHSMNHLHAQDFDAAQVEDETLGSQKLLNNEYKNTIVSYAYPFNDITAELINKLANSHIAARGGYGPTYYLKPSVNPDWMNIPSQTTLTEYELDVYKGWIDNALKDEAWTVFMIHGIEGTDWGWSPVPKKTFNGILDYLKNSKIWVAPFGTVSGYWRSQKIIEGTSPVYSANEARYSWKVPGYFPKGMKLKITLEKRSGTYELYQAGKKLKSDPKGIYSISFDTEELIVKKIKK